MSHTPNALWVVPVESLHLVGTAQHVAPVFSQLLQGPPAIIELLHIKCCLLLLIFVKKCNDLQYEN